MNKLDGPNDSEIERAVKDKARNIASEVTERGVSLLVIQEAPGPQLRESGGRNAKRIAREGTLSKELLDCLPVGFEARAVALPNKQKAARQVDGGAGNATD